MRRFLLLAMLFLAAAHPTPAQAHTPAQTQTPADSGTLKILSFNVRTWTRDRDPGSEVFWRTRMAAMERMIEDVDPDIICFQELLFPATNYVPHGYKRAPGINVSHPIYIRKSLTFKKYTLEARWEACTVAGIRIINVHTHWNRDILLRTVAQVNAQLTGCDLACGDWNNELAILQEAGLRMQSARVLLGVPETDTFFNFTRPTESHGPIDHFFIQGLTPLSYRMVTDAYGCAKISDHYPIVLTVRKPL